MFTLIFSNINNNFLEHLVNNNVETVIFKIKVVTRSLF